MTDVGQAAAGGLRQHIFRNGSTLLIRQVTSIALKFMGVLIISRILGPDKYAAYIGAYGIYTFCLGVGQAGVGIYLLRHGGEVGEKEIGTATTFLLVQSLTIVAVVELLAEHLGNYAKIPGFVETLRIIILTLPLQTLQVPALVRVERAIDLKGVAIIELSTQFCYYLLALPLALQGFGATSLAWGLIFQYAIAVVLTYRIAKVKVVFSWDSGVCRDIVRYMMSFSVANYFWQMRSLVNPFIIGPVLGPTAVGLIGMAVSVLEVLTVVRTMIWRITVAALARFQEDVAKFRNIIGEGMELQVLVIGSLLLGFGWVGQWVVPIVFGARWLPLFQVYPYIAFSYLTMSMFNMHTAALSVLNRNWLLAVYQAANVAVLAVVAFFAVHRFGIAAYGLAELSTVLSYAALHVFVAQKIGSPDYRLAVSWWLASALGLFWRELGVWTIAVPFLALLTPVSIRRIKTYLAMVPKRRAAAAALADAA